MDIVISSVTPVQAGTQYALLLQSPGLDGQWYDRTGDYDALFKTYVNTDLDPLGITKVSPTAGRTDVSSGANVTATFDEAMRTKATKGAFTLVKKTATGTSGPIPVKKSCNVLCTKVTLDPSNSLECGVTYVATVTTAAKDLAGNALEGNKPSGNYVWSFKVKR